MPAVRAGAIRRHMTIADTIRQRSRWLMRLRAGLNKQPHRRGWRQARYRGSGMVAKTWKGKPHRAGRIINAACRQCASMVIGLVRSSPFCSIGMAPLLPNNASGNLTALACFRTVSAAQTTAHHPCRPVGLGTCRQPDHGRNPPIRGALPR